MDREISKCCIFINKTNNEIKIHERETQAARNIFSIVNNDKQELLYMADHGLPVILKSRVKSNIVLTSIRIIAGITSEGRAGIKAV